MSIPELVPLRFHKLHIQFQVDRSNLSEVLPDFHGSTVYLNMMTE